MGMLENFILQFAHPIWLWAEAKPGSAQLREHNGTGSKWECSGLPLTHFCPQGPASGRSTLGLKECTGPELACRLPLPLLAQN